MQPPGAAADLTKSQRLSDLIRRPISSRLVQYVAQQAGLVIPCHAPTRTKKIHQGEKEEEENNNTQLPPLPVFVQSLIKRSCVKPGTILGTLVFLDRLQRRLAHLAKGMPCTCHRIFLATLIVTSKSLHDTSPKNKHWARYAVYFNLSEINLMEQQLLSLMNYQLIITPEEIDLVFIQYEIYKSQHQRHQQILPTPTTTNRIEPPAITTTTTNDLPAASSSCALSAAMEFRYMMNDTNGKKVCDDSIDSLDQTTKTGSYPYASLFPLASLSSSSLSSGCSSSNSSLHTPSSNLSLNLSSSNLRSTPSSSSDCIILPPPPAIQSQAPSLQQQLDQDPVLFYPPAHIHQRDTYRSSTTTWNNMMWQKPIPSAAPLLDDSLLSPTLDQQSLWTTACTNNPSL